MSGDQLDLDATLPPEGSCGFTLIDLDGEEMPCDRPGVSWRWYQGYEHEDMLERACVDHENPGGIRMAALVAEVRRLRADREMGRTNLAHYSEIIDAQAGENEQLRRRFRLCSGCDATLARCNEYIEAGAIKCCPDCRHAA